MSVCRRSKLILYRDCKINEAIWFAHGPEDCLVASPINCDHEPQCNNCMWSQALGLQVKGPYNQLTEYLTKLKLLTSRNFCTATDMYWIGYWQGRIDFLDNLLAILSLKESRMQH